MSNFSPSVNFPNTDENIIYIRKNGIKKFLPKDEISEINCININENNFEDIKESDNINIENSNDIEFYKILASSITTNHDKNEIDNEEIQNNRFEKINKEKEMSISLRPTSESINAEKNNGENKFKKEENNSSLINQSNFYLSRALNNLRSEILNNIKIKPEFGLSDENEKIIQQNIIKPQKENENKKIKAKTFSDLSIILPKNEEKRNPKFNLIKPKPLSVFKHSDTNFIDNFVIDKKINKKRIRLTKINKRKRNNYDDNIRRMIKRRFINDALLKALNNILRRFFFSKFFKKLNQKFVADVVIKNNKAIINMTLKQILEKKEFSGKKYYHNKKVLDLLENENNKELKRILNTEYKDIFDEYIHSEEFIKEFERVKKMDKPKKYIERYIFLVRTFIEFFEQ